MNRNSTHGGDGCQADGRTINQRLQGCKVTDAGLAPLVKLLLAAKPVRQKDLASALGLDDSSLVCVVGRLEKSGLIASAPDLQDGRAKALSLNGPDLSMLVSPVCLLRPRG